MTARDYRPRGVHLVGSIPLADAETVFRTVTATLSDRLERMPDGETGQRSNWIAWQLDILRRCPQLQEVPAMPTDYVPRPRFKPRPGVMASDIQLSNLGYADAAVSSYATFSQLKHAGIIPARMRFQVSLPTPLAPVSAYIVPDAQPILEPVYEAQMLAEVSAILAAIPHDQLAIQWDTAIEMGIWEGVMPTHLRDPKQGIVERLARLGSAIPAGVELGYHFCYGDARHKHFVEPADAANLVEIANAVSAAVHRPIQWMHLPVPRARTDAAYFAPMRGLKLHPEARLYLGLVHYTDGAEGARRRVETARRFVPDFGIGTECGFGRRPPETIPALLQLHREVTEAR